MKQEKRRVKNVYFIIISYQSKKAINVFRANCKIGKLYTDSKKYIQSTEM